MYHSKQHVETNGKSSLLLALIMLFGALSAGIPNASALTGNETFEVINLTNNSANLSMSNLDSSDTYYWGAYIYHSNGTLFDSDTGSTSGIGGPGTINFGVSWPTPTIPDNYTVYGEVNDGSISIGNDTHYFLIGNGGSPTIGNGSQNDAGSGGDAGDNATAAYNLTVTSGTAYSGYVDQTDVNDWYRVFVPTGKGITGTLAFNGVTNGTNDLDLAMIDSTLSFYIDTSYYSIPEFVNSSGTNVSGQYVYLWVSAYSGFSYYNLTVTFYTASSSSSGLTADQYEINDDVGNATYVSLPFSPGNLTIHNTTDWDVFAINMTSGLTYWMNTTFTHSLGDLDIYIADSSLNIMASSVSSTDDESASWTANSSGTFYGIVLGYGGATNTYGITLAGGGGGSSSGGQNDAGSGGDAGDNATAAYNLTVTSGSTYSGYVDQTDLNDWYYIFVPTGKGITASMAFNSGTNGTNDLDLYLIDSLVTTQIDTSFYSNPEFVNSSGTNVSGQYVYLVVDAFSGSSNYNITITFYNANGSSSGLTPDQYEINDDVGNATAVTLPFSPGTLTIHNTTDWDVFAISMTSGMTYWMNTTFTHSLGDLDIYIADNNLNVMASSLSSTDDESTSWTANATGTFYGIVLGWGDTNSYGITLEGGQSSSNATGDLVVNFYNRTYGEIISTNLTSGISYDLDLYLLDWNGTNFNSVGTFTNSWVSNGSNYTSGANINLGSESLFCLYGELYDMSSSSNGVYLTDEMDCLYHEMMEASITSDTTASMDAQNLTSGINYDYFWGLYIAGASNYLQTGNGSFNASSSSWNSTATWNQPNSGSLHCFYVELYTNGSFVGFHEDCFYPTWPSIYFTGFTSNGNSTMNSLYFDTGNLTAGNSYAFQVGLVQYSTNNTTYSQVSNFTSSATMISWQWNYTTPSVSGYYCAVGTLWDGTGVLLDIVTINTTSTCFLIIHDDDNDGVWNINDLCPNTPANAVVDVNGCAASQRDTDNDGVNDNLDPFPFDATQWQDSDGDGFGDNASGNNPDAFPNDSTQWSDSDGDGYGDNPNGTNADAFPTDPNQWVDSDGDGYGDNSNATGGDLWPNDPSQWWDSDGDGYGDNSSGTNGDAFPTDPNQWADSDGDGYGDNSNVTGGDLWPSDPSQWWDSDGDGYGDNSTGTNGDAFPTDSTQWSDGDGDGWGDNPNGTNPDAFPQDGTQWSDGDGDGYGDNPNGNNADAFPNDSTQWSDGDGDGYGDNPSGTNPDAFPADSTQWSDGDGDGYGDNPQGNNPDAFPTDSSQWADRDGDGYGDNPQGTNPDLCPDTPVGEIVDRNGCSSSERDSDGDGILDAVDDCVYINASGWDNDGDGCIDDTDGDGYDDPDDNCVNEDSTNYDVDQDGCIDDTDGDLVKDDVDQCPTTNASGWDNDVDGCIDDTDGDLVPDDMDGCRYVNATGYDNDGDGCIDDTDGDLIKDNLDSCPYENSTGFDDNQDGCLDDSDSDGVKDNTDICPNTLDYLTVDNDGCSDHQRDADGDTIKDFYDLCPGTSPNEQVNTDGCSPSQRDTDGDQVNDADDACPNTNDGASVNLEGCSDSQLDSDNDGVNDEIDQCSTTPQNETANNLGCSDSEWDSDGDGVMDSNDDCKNDAGTSNIDRVGCLDSDGDGVSDANDAYPNDATKQTASENTDGGIPSFVLVLVGMFVLFSIVAGAVVVLRIRGGDEEKNQFAGGLTLQPTESLTEMAMPAQAATDLGIGSQLGLDNPEPEQWVDENGVTWHRQPDGVLLRWNGEAWEPAN